MTKYNKEVREVVGLDLGDRHRQFCRLNRQGEVVEQGRVATTATAMRKESDGGRQRGWLWKPGRIHPG